MIITEDKTDNNIDLKATDRCDACSAQAYVYCKGLEGELYFCGHHYKQHEEKLNNWAFTIIDQRDKLDNKETKQEE